MSSKRAAITPYASSSNGALHMTFSYVPNTIPRYSANLLMDRYIHGIQYFPGIFYAVCLQSHHSFIPLTWFLHLDILGSPTYRFWKALKPQRNTSRLQHTLWYESWILKGYLLHNYSSATTAITPPTHQPCTSWLLSYTHGTHQLIIPVLGWAWSLGVTTFSTTAALLIQGFTFMQHRHIQAAKNGHIILSTATRPFQFL